MNKYDSKHYISAYYLAKGLLLFFSKSLIEIEKIMSSLDEDESNSYFQRILESFVKITSPSQLHAKFELLWDALHNEDLEFESVLAKKDIIAWKLSKLTAIDDSAECRELFKELSAIVFELIQCIQPLDIVLMMSLIEKFESAVNLVAGKDIVLILGETGAGKSTTIHFLAGSEMEEIDFDGFDHIHPIRASPFVSGLKVGASTQSVTKSLTAVALPNDVIICDTPGFGDTSGPETDIANGIGMIQCLCQANSVKPVMILSEGNMDRLRGVRKMKTVMNAMLVDVRALLPSMTYFFTKYQPKFCTKIWRQLEKLREEFTDADLLDSTYVAIVDDMIAKTKPSAIVVDPLQSSSQSLTAEDILQHLSSVPFFSSPDQIFRTFASPDSAMKLDEQWRVLQRQIYLGLQKENLDFLPEYFQEMLFLNKLQISEYFPIFTDSVKQLDKYVMDRFSLAKEQFTSCIDTSRAVNIDQSFLIFQSLLHLHPLLQELKSEINISEMIQGFVLNSLNKLVLLEDFNHVALNIELLKVIERYLEATFFFGGDSSHQEMYCISPNFINRSLLFSFEFLTLLQKTFSSLLEDLKQSMANFESPHILTCYLQKLFALIPVLERNCENDTSKKQLRNSLEYFWTHLRDHAKVCIKSLYPRFNIEVDNILPVLSKFWSYVSLLKANGDLPFFYPGYHDILTQIESELLGDATFNFQRILDLVKRELPADQSPYELFHYYEHFLTRISGEIPPLSPPACQVILELRTVFQRSLSDKVAKVNGELHEDPSRTHLSQSKILYSDLVNAKSFSDLPVREALDIVEDLAMSRLTLSHQFKSLPVDLDITKKIAANFRLVDFIEEIITDLSLNNIANQLRETSLDFVSASFEVFFTNLGSISLSQYERSTKLINTLNSIRLSSSCEKYALFDNIVERMKGIGRDLLCRKEEILTESFRVMQMYWNPEGDYRPLPDEDFHASFHQLKNILCEFRDVLEMSRTLQDDLSRELLYEIPKRLYGDWISNRNSKINNHLSEIFKYSFTGSQQFLPQDIYQLLLLTKEIRPLDECLVNPKFSYTAAHVQCKELIQKFSSDLLTKFKRGLEENSFGEALNIAEEIRTSSVLEIKNSSTEVVAIMTKNANFRSQRLKSLLDKLEKNWRNDPVPLLGPLLGEVEAARTFSTDLRALLEDEVYNLLINVLANLGSRIDGYFEKLLTDIEKSFQFHGLSESLDRLDIIADMNQEVLSSSVGATGCTQRRDDICSVIIGKLTKRSCRMIQQISKIMI